MTRLVRPSPGESRFQKIVGAQGARRRLGIELVTAAALSLAFALGALPGFVGHATGHLSPDHQDPLLNLYLMKWGAHQWSLGLADVWNANFFFPTRGALAMGDHLLGPALALAAITALGAGAILAFNLILLGALAASPLSLHLLLRRLGCSWGASLVAALGWGFAAYRVSHISHAQLLLALWIPPLLWCFDRFLEKATWTRAAALCLFYWLHLSGGSYLAYMAHVPLLAIAILRWREIGTALRQPARAFRLLSAALGCAAAVALLYLPYARLSRDLGIARSIGEWEGFGARATSFLAPAKGTALAFKALAQFGQPEQQLFPGAVTLLLAACGLALARPLVRSRMEASLLLGSTACLVLAFPLPFATAAHLLPGLDGMRVPARFVQLAGLGLALLAARGLDALLLRVRRPAIRGAFLALLCGLLAIELLPSGARWSALGEEADFPAVDHWIAGQSAVRAYVDLPFPPPRRLTREYLAMYLSSLHWKGLVNGRSGYVTSTWREIYAAIPVMPDGAALRLLARLGVTHVLARQGAMYEGRSRREGYLEWTRHFDRDGMEGLELVYSNGEGDRVYRLIDVSVIQGRSRDPLPENSTLKPWQ